MVGVLLLLFSSLSLSLSSLLVSCFSLLVFSVFCGFFLFSLLAACLVEPTHAHEVRLILSFFVWVAFRSPSNRSGAMLVR